METAISELSVHWALEEGHTAGGKEAATARENTEEAGDARPHSPLSSPISGHRQSMGASLSEHRAGQGRVWSVGVGRAHTQQMGTSQRGCY